MSKVFNAVATGRCTPGQHLRGHPPLERLRLRQLRREHQRVETAFVDEDGLLASSDGVANRDGILVFVIDMFSQRVTGIAVPQRICHVFAHEKRFELKGESLRKKY